jgi:membrane fusion protein
MTPVNVHASSKHMRLAIVASALTLSFIAFCLCATVPRKVIVTGSLEPSSGLINVDSNIQGTIVSIDAVDGQVVSRNAKLFRIEANKNLGDASVGSRLGDSIAKQSENLRRQISLREQQRSDRKVDLSNRVKSLLLEGRNHSDELILARKRVEVTEADLQRSSQLAASGFITKSQVLEKELQNLDAKSRVNTVEREISSNEIAIQTASAELRSLDTQGESEIEEMRRSLALTDQSAIEAAQRDANVLVAPVAGRVYLFRHSLGEAVQENQPLATIIPESDFGPDGNVRLVATLYVPSRSVGFLHRGQNVTLRYSAFPYEKYGTDTGIVISVSEAPVDLKSLPEMYQRLAVQRGSDTENYYRVVASVSPRDNWGQIPLARKAGMALEADIRQDSRHVWEIIFDPFLRARNLI